MMVSAGCQRKRDGRPLLLFGLEMGLGKEIRRHLYNGSGLNVERDSHLLCRSGKPQPVTAQVLRK